MQTRSKTVLMVMPYFGKWPDWFDLYLESCRWNPTIHWLFFTDCPAPDNSPANVNFVLLSFTEYLERASKALRLCLTWKDPYKLCDLRPALGFIHQKEIRGYDFYGYGDIDVIYGNIRKIYTGAVLDHLCVSASPNQVAGHFSLFRNCELSINAFRRIRAWEELVRDEKHHRVDELHFSRIFKRHRRFRRSLRPYKANNYFVEQFASVLADMPWIDGSMHHPELWFWKDGRLTNTKDRDREFLYLHFMNWKSARCLPQFRGASAAWERLPCVNFVPKEKIQNGWTISRNGFHPLNDSRQNIPYSIMR